MMYDSAPEEYIVGRGQLPVTLRIKGKPNASFTAAGATFLVVGDGGVHADLQKGDKLRYSATCLSGLR